MLGPVSNTKQDAPMAEMTRVSLTLPPAVVEDLAYVARRLGVSRSALAADLLRDPLASTAETLREIDAPSVEPSTVRYRGESQRVVDERLESARRLGSDLFSSRSGRGGGDE